MTTIQNILRSQPWVSGLLRNSTARSLILSWADRLPRHVRKEISTAAKVGGVSQDSLLACNFAYEVSMLGAALREGVPAGRGLGAFETANVSPLGCTTCAMLDFDASVGLPFNEHIHFGRNLDWPDADDVLRDNTGLEVKASHGCKGKSYDTVTFPGFSGVFTGYAKGRFAVAMNAVLTGEQPNMHGASPAFLLREVLDEYPTFEEAVKVLSDTPLLVSVLFTVVSSYEFAGQRDAVVIERSPSRSEVRYPEQVSERIWAVSATNTALRLPCLELDGLSETSCDRYDRVMKMAADYEDISDILDASDFGLTIYSATGDLVSDPHLAVF